MFWFLVGLGAVAFAYFACIKPFSYWKRKGVPQWSLLKVWLEMWKQTLQMEATADAAVKMFGAFPHSRYSGMYQFATPVLLLRDPDLIKQITVKDFDHFLDHNQPMPEDVEPLWSKNLFALKGDRWKDMRSTLSPSFTSSKMKAMFYLINDCSTQFVRYFKEQAGSKTHEVEMKDAFGRFATDVIASAAFGITCDSLKEKDNEFYLTGKEALNFRGVWKNIKFLVLFLFPTLGKALGIKMFSDDVRAFFRKIVKESIESREKSGIVRPDMIHLLMEARKGRLKHEHHSNGVIDSGFAVIEESEVGKQEKRQKHQLTDDDLTAQALLFFFGGFESVSTQMCFLAHELAINPDVQERLRQEVDETLKGCNGKLTYEALLKMKYLDMVVSEALRKWPAPVAVDRVCNKPYTIEPVKKGEKPVQIDKGDALLLPMFGLHRDPKYYPNPDRFDPERFSDENKGSIYPYSYIPFGAGPRSCIGTRFALLEVKTVIFHILAHFGITVIDKTVVPIKLAKNQPNLTAEGGFWLGFKPRNVQ